MENKRVSIIEQQMHTERKFNKPGPDKYNQMKSWEYSQKKTPGNYNCTDPVAPFTADSEARGLAIPAMTKYQSVDLSVYKHNSPRWKIARTKDMG